MDADHENLSAPGAYSGVAPDRGRVELLEPAAGAPSSEGALARFREVLVDPDRLAWMAKSLEGLSQKMLWRDDESGASIALVRFLAGAGIPSVHAHASNQFMYCLEGRYEYTATGLTLTRGSFYWNPKGCAHGPTRAHEDSVLLEVYDGPHYPTQPEWYSDTEDAR